MARTRPFGVHPCDSRGFEHARAKPCQCKRCGACQFCGSTSCPRSCYSMRSLQENTRCVVRMTGVLPHALANHHCQHPESMNPPPPPPTPLRTKKNRATVVVPYGGENAGEIEIGAAMCCALIPGLKLLLPRRAPPLPTRSQRDLVLLKPSEEKPQAARPTLCLSSRSMRFCSSSVNETIRARKIPILT